MTVGNPVDEWNFLLEQLCRTPGIDGAIAVSSDGILQARSEGLDRDDAERLAAVTSGMSSLAEGAARVMRSGAVTRNLIETEGGYLVVATVNAYWILAVVAAASSDLGQIGFEIDSLANAVKDTLGPAPAHAAARA
nr:roadblock/LC7 domain-containing protein [Dactylosporangium thailandense]